jgi:hypothetical protein
VAGALDVFRFRAGEDEEGGVPALTLEATILDPNPQPFDYLGGNLGLGQQSVAVGEGRIVVGSSNGSENLGTPLPPVYVFERRGGAWALTAEATSPDPSVEAFGQSVWFVRGQLAIAGDDGAPAELFFFDLPWGGCER